MKIKKIKNSKIDSLDIENDVFGKKFTDHMLICNYQNNQWEEASIIPYSHLNFSPSIMALHYGQCVFEGMKAYKDANSQVFLFRPEKNFHRFNESCKRLAMPEITKEIFLNGIYNLVNLDRKWVPNKIGTSLYIRPFMFASEEAIYARISNKYTFIVLCLFANNYYNKPIKVKIEQNFSRSVHGGIGYAKTAGNYAGSFYPTKLANLSGFEQIIWTDALSHNYIEESGTMNIIFRISNYLFTPPISDTILDGITRDSLIKLAKYNNIKVIEKKISIEEIYSAYKNNTLKEVFGCGTAVVVNRFSSIGYKDEILKLPIIENKNSFAENLKNQMINIQYNLSKDIFNWMVLVKEKLI